jgi:choice-of-anchor C domain-containing protein
MKTFALGLVALLALPAAANATAFSNGGFETGTTPGSFSTVNAGGADIAGWDVVSGSDDYIGNYWQAGEGARSVDLNGNDIGAIAQTFDTIFGVKYVVDFLIAGNPDGTPTLKSLDVAATGNAAAQFSFLTTGNDKSAMGWLSKRYTFIATGTSTTLSFTSLDHSAYGTALDGVNVAAVPEPATWAMMFGGLALVGTQMRRRKTVLSFA